MKALIIAHTWGAIGLYIAAAYLFSQSGTFSITALEHLDPSAKTIVLFGVMFAAWGKSAQLPMQIWFAKCDGSTNTGERVFARRING